MQRLVDGALAVAKESVKTITYESLNSVARVINGASALLLAILPGKTSILEGINGWELRPTFRGPRLPRWMENGASSFNQLIHELSAEYDPSSISDCASGDEDDDDSSQPATPLSQVSRFSRASYFPRHDRHQVFWIGSFLLWIFWPLIFLIRIPMRIFHSPGAKKDAFTCVDGCANHRHTHSHSKKINLNKDHLMHHTTDRRRGVVEDLQLAIEIFIESVFEKFHSVAHHLLSPFATCQLLFRYIFSCEGKNKDVAIDVTKSVPTSVLGNVDPTPTEQEATFHPPLNTDCRTCKDVIRELGYPYEAIHVITSDGYILLLERMPRHDSRKVIYLQHGILDSSLGWVSNGVVGSPAFAAYDQGYDVFLGNLRGLVSRGHVDKNISSRKYWRYSVNEHGTQDIPAMLGKIHAIKTSELQHRHPEHNLDKNDQPYKLSAICHSLGGAVMLMYIITRRLENLPHRLSRLVLLSPAGFHEECTIALTVLSYLLRLLAPILAPLVPGFYIPTRFFRMLFNKLARDFHNYPAVGGLVQTLLSYVVGGDSSNWVGVIGQPHYNMNDMPGVSYYVAVHLSQMKHSRKFIMYDFGNANANMKAYGTALPLDLGSHYDLIDVPVDLVAGRKDKVIPASMVRKHYKLMKNSGVDVSYNEFKYAHVDFLFSHSEELLAYVMSRLLLVEPPASLDQSKAIRQRKASKRSSKRNLDFPSEVKEVDLVSTE
ncbi:unnamed protein product [Victoria cruziana]